MCRVPLLAFTSPPRVCTRLVLLVLQFAYKYGTSEVPRAWSRYTSGTSANKKAEHAGSGANTVPLGEDAAGGEGVRAALKKKNKAREPKAEEGAWVEGVYSFQK
jgi:hypothetical protein